MLNKRFLINSTAAVVVILLLVWFARSMDSYQPSIPQAGETTAETTPSETRAETPAEAPSDLGTPPGSQLADAAAQVRHAEVGFRDPVRLTEHFEKHGAEFGDVTVDAYLLLAQSLRDRPAGGDVLERTRKDGVITRFDRATGSFLAFDKDLTIRTFFRPNDGESYFTRQSLRD
jgi:pyocin large subunit-like protein